MSILVNGITVSMIHIRHDGRSHEIFVDDLSSVDSVLNSSQLLSAVENYLDLSEDELNGYEVDIDAMETQNVIIRPQAKFGEEQI